MKPGDFLLSVLDLFGVLLPGVVTTWLLLQYVPGESLRTALVFRWASDKTTPEPAVVVAALLIVAYTLGNFVFMVGSILDRAYYVWRKRFKVDAADKTYRAAEALYRSEFSSLHGGDFTTLKWARAYVGLKAPAAMTEIDRLEANSKFFRSLIVVSAALVVHFVWREKLLQPGVIALGGLILSFFRYVEQRWKTTELTYATAVILKIENRGVTAATASSKQGL